MKTTLTPQQARAIREQVKYLTNHGRHLEALNLFNEHFRKA
jgi:hypothetical protein